LSISSSLSSPRGTLSTRATTIYAAIAAISFSATSSAPTPLYHFYQKTMDLSPLTVTVIFAAYAFAMMASFLTVARLSDYVGRRPMIFAALAINAVALLLFITAGQAWELILARVVQGFGTGIALTTLGATILDTDKANGSLYNSVTAFVGLMLGTLVGGILVAFAPLPGQLIYVLLLAVTLIEAAMLLVTPETTSGRPGALAVLKPHVSVPKAALPALIKLLPLNVAGWALGGFYLSLMPTLVTLTTGAKSLFVGAAVVSALMLTASITVLAFRKLAPERMLLIAMLGLIGGIAVTLGAVYLQSAPLMILGTIFVGVGFGNAYSGNLRTLLPLAGEHERAGLLAAYFVESYLAFAIPAIAAGLAAPVLGLVTTSYIYGAVMIGLIAVSLVATQQKRREIMLEI
jgi:MFS family permease